MFLRLAFLFTILFNLTVNAQDCLPNGNWRQTGTNKWETSGAKVYQYKVNDYQVASYQAKKLVSNTPVDGYSFVQYESQEIFAGIVMHMGMFQKGNTLMVRVILTGEGASGYEPVFVGYLTKFSLDIFEGMGYIAGCRAMQQA